MSPWPCLMWFLCICAHLLCRGPIDGICKCCPDLLFGVLFFDPKLSYRTQFKKLNRCGLHVSVHTYTHACMHTIPPEGPVSLPIPKYCTVVSWNVEPSTTYGLANAHFQHAKPEAFRGPKAWALSL